MTHEGLRARPLIRSMSEQTRSIRTFFRMRPARSVSQYGPKLCRLRIDLSCSWQKSCREAD